MTTMSTRPLSFRRSRRRRVVRGFTLLEIMLVVTIIILLLGAGVKFLLPNLVVGQETRVQADLMALRTSLSTYQGLNGFLPTTEQGLGALVTSPQSEPKPATWRKLMDEIPKDSWGQDYVYVQPGKHNPEGYDVYSKGPDRVADTADDIGNWKK